jgi:two-component system, NarL family, nitrate/nitrite response regulator NarL
MNLSSGSMYLRTLGPCRGPLDRFRRLLVTSSTFHRQKMNEEMLVFSFAINLDVLTIRLLSRKGNFMGGYPQMSPQGIRVAVADATRMNSQLIVGALKRCHSSFDVHALTSNSSVAFRELQHQRPDVAVISARLEDGPLTGFKILHQLRASESKTPTVMLLDSTERDLVIDAFRGGARGVFCRGYSFNALPKCIRKVHEGQIWVSNIELEFLLELVITLRPLKIQHTGGMTLLTPRERDVVRLVAEGMRNQEIALKLNLSEHTVRNYLLRIFDKLGISSRVELVLYAFSGVEGSAAPVASRAHAASS